MNKFKCVIPVLFALFALTTGSAQDYQSALGARLGSPLSASYKTFLGGSNNAFEAYAGFRNFGAGYSWVTISGAYQIHNPIEDVEGLQWYFGGGASVYFWSFDFATNESTTTFGIQGYIGLDYKFEDYPINLSLDWIPTLFISGIDSGFGPGFGSLGVRYVLGDD